MILSSISKESELEKILYQLAETIENDLHCYVYLECDDCCFIPYPLYEDVVGEINIDGSLTNFERLVALTHEVGHVLDNSDTNNIVQVELNAWHLGYKYMLMESIFIDSEEYLYRAQQDGKKILAEGAQGSLLDIDFGTYPYVTSSNTTAAGACTGLGVAPNKIGEVFGIFKAYTTRVGSGPFPTELFDDYGETMGRVGREFGATTGRPRRCGWLDLVALKYAVQVNGVTQLMMMKGDVLSGFDKLMVATAYKYKGETITHLPYNIEPENVEPIYTEMKGWSQDLTGMTQADQLPEALNDYIAYLEQELQVPIKIVSVGPDRTQTIHR